MRNLVASLALLWAGALAASPMTLVSPRAGEVLHGDRFATIAWTPAQALDAEEWEAFLSVDGGRYYAARITPHLDIAMHAFQFVVPNIASDDVRILIRAGDEKNESIFELPQRFSIRPSPSLDLGSRFRASAESPEAARPGDAPVVEWASGSRSGAGFEVHRANARGAALFAVHAQERQRFAALAGCRNERRTVLATRLIQQTPTTANDRTIVADVFRLTTRMNV